MTPRTLLRSVGRRADSFLLGGRLQRRAARRRADATVSRLRERVVVDRRTHRGPSSNDLAVLCDRYGSDKGTAGSPSVVLPWAPHNYCDVYTELLADRRDAIRRVFECGIGTVNTSFASNMTATGRPGASLRVWRDHLPNAEVIGADIDPETMFTEERITTYVLDQCDPDSIRSMWEAIGPGTVDLIVDDGLHQFQAGRCLFEHSIEHLAEDGIYIIEDVRSPDVDRYVEFFTDGGGLRLDGRDRTMTVVVFDDATRTGLAKNSLIVIR